MGVSRMATLPFERARFLLGNRFACLVRHQTTDDEQNEPNASCNRELPCAVRPWSLTDEHDASQAIAKESYGFRFLDSRSTASLVFSPIAYRASRRFRSAKSSTASIQSFPKLLHQIAPKVSIK